MFNFFIIICGSSGNTGIGLALAAAVKGYKCIIVMPEKMSNEKVNVLRALGAEIIRTPTSARFDAANSHIRVAQKLQTQIPRSIILDQYRNPANPLAHYDTTGAEILQQTGGKLDYVVLGAGTGGTVTGIGRRIKEGAPDCVVVGVDPKGSILAEPEELNASDTTFYEVEGIGYDFIPTVLDRSVVDRWIKTDDKESLEMARNLIRLEGILCGGSSGTAVTAAVQVARELPKGKRVVVLLPDGVRNYMTKFLDDDWMENRDFNYPSRKETTDQPWYYGQQVAQIIKGTKGFHFLFWSIKQTVFNNFQFNCLPGFNNVIMIDSSDKCNYAIRLMRVNGFDQLPVVQGDNKNLLGMVTVDQIMAKVSAGVATLDDPVEMVLLKTYPSVKVNDPLGALIKVLRQSPYVAIKEQLSDDVATIAGIVTHIDILDYIANVGNKK